LFEAVEFVLTEVDLRTEVGGVGEVQKPLDFVEGVERVVEQFLHCILEQFPVGAERGPVVAVEGDRDLELLGVGVLALLVGLVADFRLEVVDHLQELVLDAAAHHVLHQLQELQQHLIVLHCEHVFDPPQVGFLRLLNQGFVLVVLEYVVLVFLHCLLLDAFAQVDQQGLYSTCQVSLKRQFNVFEFLFNLIQKLVDFYVVVCVFAFGFVDILDGKLPDFLLNLHQLLALHGLGHEKLVHE